MQWPVRTTLRVLLFIPMGAMSAQHADSPARPEPTSTPDAALPGITTTFSASPDSTSSDSASPGETTTFSPSPGDPTDKPPEPNTAPENAPSDTLTGVASGPNVPYHWLDWTRQVLYDSMWHSAEHVDRWFGSVEDDTVYQQIYGSIAPAVLYTQYNGLRAQLRFNMNIPLPQINDRFHAFIGRFDPNEFITERDEPSGAFPRTYGPQTEDQTLLGIGYHQPEKSTQQGGHFDAGAGIRISLPMDPYIKGSYVYERGTSETGLFSVRETLFWQHSDGAGETSRLDLERILDSHWLLRYTASATRSQDSQGLRGYSSFLALHSLAPRRAIACEVGFDGETEAPVPLHDYGLKVALRQGILRSWLVMEIRTSIDWPRDFTYQQRPASLGIGIGFEMLFGTEQFLARPVTF